MCLYVVKFSSWASAAGTAAGALRGAAPDRLGSKMAAAGPAAVLTSSQHQTGITTKL